MKKHLLKSWGRCEVSEETSLTSQPTLPIKVVVPGRVAVIHPPLRSKKKTSPRPTQFSSPLQFVAQPLNPSQSYAQSHFPTAGRAGSREKGSC